MSKMHSKVVATLIASAIICSMMPMTVFAAEETVTPTDLPSAVQEDIGEAAATEAAVPSEDSEEAEAIGEAAVLNEIETQKVAGAMTLNSAVLAATTTNDTSSDILKSGSCGENLTYTLTTDGVLTISGYGEMDDFDLERNHSGFSNRESIKSVQFDGNITSIGDEAFFGCKNLTNITIPASVTSIGDSVFNDCPQLSSIDIEAGNQYFTKIDGVIYNKEITRLVAFPGTKTTANNIPDSVSDIGNFDCHQNLESITIPKSVESIGPETFLSCANLKEVVISEGVKNISSYAFWACPKLNRIVLPKSIELIHEDGLDESSKIDLFYAGSQTDWKNVTLGTRNRTIKWAMEYGRFRFNSNDIISYGDCGERATYTLYNDGLLKIDGQWPMYTYDDDNNSPPWDEYRDSIKTLDISNNISLISSYSFESCHNLTKVISTFRWNVPKECFHNSGISEIVLGDNVQYIGADAFSACYSLKSIVIPKSVKSIGSYAFASSGLTDVYYPGTEDEWNKIQIEANAGLKTLQENGKIHFNYGNIVDEGQCGEHVNYTLLKDGRLILSGYGATYDYDAAGSGTPWKIYREKINSIEFSSNSNITQLGYGIFQGCTKVETVTFSDTVTSILGYAFSECVSIKKIVLPESITVLEETVFNNCGALKDVTLPRNLTSIGRHAFSCTAITEITLPDTLTTIKERAFNATSLTNITISDSVTKIEYGAFGNCESLKTVTIPLSVTSIAKATFENDTSLTDVYYGGSQASWNKIIIGSDNDALLNATLHTTEYDVQPNVNGAASKLYEPWGLRYYAAFGGEDSDKIADRGIAILKDTYYTDGMTPEEFCANANAHLFLDSKNQLGFDDGLGAYYATLEEGIYSYDIAAKYYVVPFAVMENGETIYGSIKSNSLENILNTNLTSSSVSAAEQAICRCILALKDSVAAHYAAEGIPGASAALTIPRGSSQSAAPSVKTTQQSGITPNVYGGASRLIEPWGLRYFASYPENANIAERGMVILNEAYYQESYSNSPDSMRRNANAYVFRDSDGTLLAESSTNYFATVGAGISSKDIADVYYVVPFAVLKDGSYVYGQVKSNSMLKIMNANLNASTVPATERAVSEDIIDLYNAVKAYYDAQ